MQRVRSTQKLPIVCAERRAKPRISATASAMPVAAETEVVHGEPGHLRRDSSSSSRRRRTASWCW